MKKNTVIFWIATTIIILWEGLMPVGTVLFAPEYATVGTQPLGYPDYFAYTLIFCKVLGVIAIAIPKIPSTIKEWAYAGLSFNLVFAAISHAFVDGNPGFIIMPLVFLAILMVSYFFNKKIKHDGQNKLSNNSRLSPGF